MAHATLSHSFSPNTPIYSGQVNSNFSTITAQLNGNVDATNLASGAVTPSRIATLPRCKAMYGGAFAQASGGGGTIFLGAAEFDTDNMYDDVNDYMVVQTAGVYHVSSYFLQTAGGAGTLIIRRGPGGVFPTPGAANMVAADDNRNGTGQHLTAAGSDYFAAGDRIDVQWYNYAAGANSLLAGFLIATWLAP